jgi:hypothetical protein
MKPGTYVVCAVENVEKLLFGRVERELSSPDRIVAEIHNSVYITLPRFRVQRLPNRQVDAAKHAMNHPIATAAGVADLVALALVVPVMILETGSGGAILRVLSALGGSGVGGIIIISVAPAGLSATALERLCAKRENDSVTKKVVGAASATGPSVKSYTKMLAHAPFRSGCWYLSRRGSSERSRRSRRSISIRNDGGAQCNWWFYGRWARGLCSHCGKWGGSGWRRDVDRHEQSSTAQIGRAVSQIPSTLARSRIYGTSVVGRLTNSG